MKLGMNKTPEQVAEIVALLHKYESIGYARDLARGLIVESRSYLSALTDTDAKMALLAMADFFLERES